MSPSPIEHAARHDPAARALVDGDRELTWSEVADLVAAIGARLLDVAGGPGERVAVVGENAAATLLTHVAGICHGVGTVATAKQLRAEEMADQFADAGVTAVVTGPAGLTASVDAARRLGLRTVVVHGTPAPAGVVGWRDWLAAAVGAGSTASNASGRPVAVPMVYTSGTTGRARGTEVRWAARTLTTAGEYVAELAAGNGYPAGPHLVCGPLQHNGPLTAVRHLIAGQPVVVLPGFEAEKALRAIDTYRVTSAMMVPTHFQRLLALPEPLRQRYELGSLRLVVHTGSACRSEVKTAMIEWFGPVFVEAYGASEIGTIARIDSHEWLAHPGSVGRACAPFEILILDEQGHPVPAGEPGRIAVRAPEQHGVRYHADPAKTAEATVAPGVYALGDVGRLDADGYLYITGRESDMVISGGVNLYPAESEQVLGRQPGVAEVAVIGVPHPDLGEALLALVLAEGGEPPDLDELDRACRAAIAGYKCPKAYELVTDLPRNAMGKIEKRRLRERYWSGERTIAG